MKGPEAVHAGPERPNPVAERLARLKAAGRKAFVPFVMAGYPTLEATADLLRGLAQAGADAIEVGVPFSDPLADGPVNQTASHAALQGGTTPEAVLALLEAVAPEIACPLMLFTYLNPVLQRGVAAFVERAARAGAAGFVIPDLPPEAGGELAAQAAASGLGLTFLVAPTSPEERLRLADRASTAFLYAVSLRGVTGERRSLPPDLPVFLRRVKAVAANPVLLGFGISTPEQAREAAGLTDGVIVGSALVRLAGEKGVGAACRLAEDLRRAI
ncbi:MAG TPA: tryptophan synthase subunit alpha [Firmicutes bacterium]|nr:tryptophan synthase subunit alpha [Bacillota bacterium]